MLVSALSPLELFLHARQRDAWGVGCLPAPWQEKGRSGVPTSSNGLHSSGSAVTWHRCSSSAASVWVHLLEACTQESSHRSLSIKAEPPKPWSTSQKGVPTCFSAVSYPVERLQLAPFIFGFHVSAVDSLGKFESLFRGIGCPKHHVVHLHINQFVQSVALAHRKTAFRLRPKVKVELQKLEAEDIIEKVEGPTTWVFPIVFTQKLKQPEEVLICADMCLSNTAITVERHKKPIVNNIVGDAVGIQIVLKDGFLVGLPPDPFGTRVTSHNNVLDHTGLQCYKRHCFGIYSAAKVFQDII
ncbi:hypothetical protein NDU88_001047 [Pleurodeles waltl]|uniref:Uncharacterized protein n=1 Tax=Pleurodeles waltl TaxID=8319 RepID=A0AAV7R9L9_PLEWA|nr:hypothetical protein NDU88_001047 [Pleurodeles waltl]